MSTERELLHAHIHCEKLTSAGRCPKEKKSALG